MCGKPKTVEQDPEGDARRAAEKATAEANTKKSMRRGTTGAASLLSPVGEETKGSISGVANALVKSKYGGVFKKSTLGGG